MQFASLKKLIPIFVFLLPLAVLAIEKGWPIEIGLPGIPEGTRVEQPAQHIRDIYIAGTLVAGIIAVGIIVYAGFLWMTSPAIESIENAKKRIWGAVIGIALLLASFLILNTINPELINLTMPGVGKYKTPEETVFKTQDGFLIKYEQGGPESEPDLDGTGESRGSKAQAGPIGNLVSLKQLNLPFTGCCTNCRGDKINEGFVPIARKLYESCGNLYIVTCAYSPGEGHSRGSRHYAGMALDITPTKGFAALRSCIQKAGLGGNLHDESRGESPHFHVSDTGR